MMGIEEKWKIREIPDLTQPDDLCQEHLHEQGIASIRSAVGSSPEGCWRCCPPQVFSPCTLAPFQRERHTALVTIDQFPSCSNWGNFQYLHHFLS